MTRPWLIWLLSLLCAAGIFGAMGVITHRSLNLEREWAQARADAELQERLRLALWRMETEASSLMIEENNRPPEQFRRGKGSPAASPLGIAVPKHVRLHFEIAPDRTVMSPQVPRAGDPQYQVAEKNLTRLRELLARPAGAAICSCVTPAVAAPEARLLSNATFIEAAARNKGPFEWSAPPSQNDAYLDAAQNLVLNAGVQQGQIMEAPAVEAMKQSALNNLEMNRRAQVYTRKVEEKISMQGQEKSSSSAPPAKEKQGKPTPKPGTPSSKKAAPAPAPGASSQATAGSQAVTSTGQASVPPDSLAGDTANQKTAEATPQQRVTPFSPFWLENELFLVREVFESGKRHVQGVWLDADSLKASLLEAVVDLLPQAALLPVASVRFAPAADARLVSTPVASSGDPMDLIGLPWKLVPGVKPVAALHGWTPMRLTLAAAWFGALLAVVAAAALLFGVTRLSERRAAFVSSVTHELRTPLTTFRLYSELLEQGMVREEADRTQYLHTLRTEAERLTHLVDNVLAYSRIERTHRRSRMERLELTSWLERTRGRLEDRVREAGMRLDVSMPPEEAELACVTDATALEQIAFNLIDNACKYAAGRCTEPVVRLALDRVGRWVTLRVCDSGPGISRRERSRLFRPFHKSADEAANTKPGVGLGLALCHRLAKALGGKLSLERPEGPASGACFVLRLPGA